MKFNKKKYLANSGNICPYCDSKNISTVEQVQPDGDSADQGVKCHDCGKTWRDVYDLVDVEED